MSGDDATKAKKLEPSTETHLPISRVKKIIKRDDSSPLVSSDGVFCVSKSTVCNIIFCNVCKWHLTWIDEYK